MSVGDLFADAQKSVHSHKSLAKRLRKLESKYIQRRRNEEFEDQIKGCVIRLFEVAKSEPAGTRTVKFLNTYFATPLTNEKSKRSKRSVPQSVQDDEDDEMGGLVDESEHSRDLAQEAEETNAVANTILTNLIPYLSAKDKTVRYRATQIISSILSSLDYIDDDLYKIIRNELTKRLKDRVPAIRLEAVLVLGPLVEGEIESAENTRLERGDRGDEDDSDYDYEGVQASGLLEKLLDVLCNDTNADVRRALLVNLPVSPETLPYLLERARDKDAATRRAFYLKLCLQKLGDFRHLSVSMREKLLRWGLRDRDEKVRKAAARMFREKWIEDCAKSHRQTQDNGSEEQEKEHDGPHDPNIPALLELLERIDVINSGAEGGIALEAMKEFWAGRPDYVDEPTFDDSFWQNLSPESAFMARSWNDYCQSNSDCYELIENRMPEVTRFGFLLQHQINELTSKIENNKQQDGGDEEETTDQEFIVEQMLYIAHTLDYTDEIGRRKMFGLFRNAITMPDFPDECTKLAVEALRLTCTSDAAGEREFSSVILEAISEVHDSISTPEEENTESNDAHDEEDSFVSAHSEVSQTSTSTTATAKPKSKSKSTSSEQEDPSVQLRQIIIQLKCLTIAHSMLQNISGKITSNIHTGNLLTSLIIPCVRSHDAPIRERGLECLGLSCLLEPNIAVKNWGIFVHCLEQGDDIIQELCLKVLCDVLISNCTTTTTTTTNGVRDETETEHEETNLPFDISPFIQAFEYEPSVQSIATTSLGKLMLCGFYSRWRGEFDEAVELAETQGVKGWEILGKVRIAVRPTEEVEEERKDEGDREGAKTPRKRRSADA